MKWINGETCKSQRKRKEVWHKWFAWHPVRVGKITVGEKTRYIKVWLCYVQRQGIYCSGYGESVWVWEYNEIKRR
jgi:hypothetical protein